MMEMSNLESPSALCLAVGLCTYPDLMPEKDCLMTTWKWQNIIRNYFIALFCCLFLLFCLCLLIFVFYLVFVSCVWRNTMSLCYTVLRVGLKLKKKTLIGNCHKFGTIIAPIYLAGKTDCSWRNLGLGWCPGIFFCILQQRD